MADRMDELGVPLGPESGTAICCRFGDPVVALEIFGDVKFPRLTTGGIGRDLLQQEPAVRNLGPGFVGAVAAPDLCCCVPAQTVRAKVFQPHAGVVQKVAAYLRSTVVRAGVSPRRFPSIVVVEVDSAPVSFVPAVEAPQVEILGTH